MPGLVRLLVRKQMSFFVFVSLTQIYTQVKRRIENRSIDLNELHSKATWSKHTY